MRYVYCPFCDNIQEQVGFRPMTFNCLSCGSEGNWYNGREAFGIDRGFIAWKKTYSTIGYWDRRSFSYRNTCKNAEEVVGLEFKAAVAIFGNAAEFITKKIELAERTPPTPETAAAILVLKTLQAMLNSNGKAMLKTGAEYLGKVSLRATVVCTIPFTMLDIVESDAQAELSGQSSGEVEGDNAQFIENTLARHTQDCVLDSGIGVALLTAFIKIGITILASAVSVPII